MKSKKTKVIVFNFNSASVVDIDRDVAKTYVKILDCLNLEESENNEIIRLDELELPLDKCKAYILEAEIANLLKKLYRQIQTYAQEKHKEGYFSGMDTQKALNKM